jgi:CubicO group peptidase (beta-lactamase class C family)
MLFRLGSTTKMFTAAALVSLAEEGKLTLDGPVGSHIPGLHASIAALTPHQLLTHTAGLTDESVMSGLHDESALAAGVRAMNASWLFTDPGRIHSYANPGYWIAGLACAEVTGKPYAEVLDQRLFRPLGMTRTTLKPTLAMTWPLALGHEVRGGSPAIIRPQADNAATWPAGQMYSNVGELARFSIALLNDGKLEGKQVLSPALISKLSEPYVTRPGSDDHYGYGLVVSDYRGVRVWSHGGSRAGYGSTIRLAPEHKVAVIILANRSASSLPKTAAKALDLMLPVGPATPTVVAKPQSFTEAEIAALAGVYSNHRQTIELLIREGKLQLRRGSASAVPVMKIGENRLATGLSDPEASTLFVVRGADGSPEYLCSGSRALKRQNGNGN